MRKFLMIFILLAGGTAIAQQDALFSQYMFNKLVINPAYTGTRDALSITLVGRQQWVGLDGAPKTATFSLHSPLRNEKLGLGVYAYTDVLGPLQNSGAVGSFSYKFQWGPGKLSFGLQFGFKHMSIDWTKIEMPEENDIAYLGETGDNFVMDANFGLYYYSDRYYVGLSSKHLLQQEVGTQALYDEVVANKLLRHFYGMAGIAIPLSDHLVLKPSILAKYVSNTPLQMDFNANLMINEVMWVGLSYRTEGVFVFLIEVLVTDRLRIGYSYDTFLNELSLHNRGSHEVLIGFDFPVFKRRMLTPRYF
ncbi:MAG: type IX secretion system membrane protein PorP/SprF [Bacteroidota bacterium]